MQLAIMGEIQRGTEQHLIERALGRLADEYFKEIQDRLVVVSHLQEASSGPVSTHANSVQFGDQAAQPNVAHLPDEIRRQFSDAQLQVIGIFERFTDEADLKRFQHYLAVEQFNAVSDKIDTVTAGWSNERVEKLLRGESEEKA